jgi:hypothetical protein
LIQNDEILIDIDEETLKFIGEDPQTNEQGINIHKDILNRWTNMIKQGLDKENKEGLF